MPQLNTYVHVQDSDGNSREFGPGVEVPAWAVALICNPDVWATPPTGDQEPAAVEPDSVPIESAPKRTPRKPNTVKAAQ